MRHTPMLLFGVTSIFLAMLGCKHHQPELKPPPQPEVLAAPDDKDKRFDAPCKYPAETLVDDYFKVRTKADGTPMKAGGSGMNMGMRGN